MSQFTTFIKQNSKDEPTLWTFRGETFILSDDSEHITPLSGDQEPLTYTAFRKQYLSEYVRLPRVIPKDAASRELFENLSPSKRGLIEVYRRAHLFYNSDLVIPPEAAELVILYNHFFLKGVDGVVSRNWRAYRQVFAGFGDNQYYEEAAAFAFAFYGPYYDFRTLRVGADSKLSIKPLPGGTLVEVKPFGYADLTVAWANAAEDALRNHLRFDPDLRDRRISDNIFFSHLYAKGEDSLSLTKATRVYCTGVYERVLKQAVKSNTIPEGVSLFFGDYPVTSLPPQKIIFRHDDWIKMPYTLTSAAQEQRQNNADAANFEVYLRVFPQLPDKPFPTELLNSLCPNSVRTYKKWEELGYIAAVGRDPKTYKKLWRKIYDPFIIDAPGEDD